MTAADGAPPSTPRPWGYLATLGWALLTVAGSAIATAGALDLWFPGRTVTDPTLDGPVFGLVSVAAIAAELLILALAARLARWRVVDYLGLTLPSRRDAALALAGLTAFVLAFDALTYLLGKDVVTPFQDQIYRSARDAGTLSVLFFAIVIAAPVGEEIMFRGFLFRSWTQKPRDLIPGIILISGLWAALHSQYDWFGVFQIFLIGLLLGWVRWRSGSTLLTIALHAIINLWATIQTYIKIEWMA